MSLLLGRLGPDLRVVGRASGDGFFLYGDMPQRMLSQCVQEALDSPPARRGVLGRHAALRHQHRDGRHAGRPLNARGDCGERQQGPRRPRTIIGCMLAVDRGAAARPPDPALPHHQRRPRRHGDRGHRDVAERPLLQGAHQTSGRLTAWPALRVPVAQRIERPPSKRRVAGSNPARDATSTWQQTVPDLFDEVPTIMINGTRPGRR